MRGDSPKFLTSIELEIETQLYRNPKKCKANVKQGFSLGGFNRPNYTTKTPGCKSRKLVTFLQSAQPFVGDNAEGLGDVQGTCESALRQLALKVAKFAGQPRDAFVLGSQHNR